MTELIPCPSCQTMNRPEQERCHACGRSLRGAKAAAGPVGLKRVMGGEVFTAVLQGSKVDEPPEEADHASAPAAKAEDVHATLAGVADRLQERATSTGQRFKPYSRQRSRSPQRPEDRATVKRQLESAARAFREKDYETAVDHLLKAIAKDDGDARSWALLGEAYLRFDRPYKAAVGYLQALELDPGRANAWFGLARALKSIGDLGGARELLDRTIEMSPNLAEAWSERGQVLEALGKHPEAAASYARALQIRPDHPLARERFAALAEETAAPAAATESVTAAAVAPKAAPTSAEDEEELPDFTDLVELPAKEAAPHAKEEGPMGHPARIHTYVEGLDDTIGGGIPWGHVVLIEGSPGTMKSSLGFSILLQNAARDGLHCLYLSLEERTSSLLKQMGSLGLHLGVNRGSLVVLDPRTAKGMLDARPDWVEAVKAAVASVQAQRGLDLLVIDSLEALEVLAKFQDRRREIFRLFEWLRDLDVTSFVVTERPDWVVGGHVIQGRWDEDFLADGVVHLRQHLVSDLEVQRRLRVVKLRGTRHDTGYMALVLDDGRFRVTRAMSP